MSQPELPDHTTAVSELAVNVPLKLGSLAAGIPILFLRQELGSEALIVFLTLRSYRGSSARRCVWALGAWSRKDMRRVNVKTHCLLADTRIALLIGEDVMNK